MIASHAAVNKSDARLFTSSGATISPFLCSQTARLRSDGRSAAAKDSRDQRRPRVVHPGTCHSRTPRSRDGQAIWAGWGGCMCQGAQVQVGASGAVYLSGVCTWGALVLAARRIGRLQIELMSSYHSDKDPNVAFHGRWFQPRVQHDCAVRVPSGATIKLYVVRWRNAWRNELAEAVLSIKL